MAKCNNLLIAKHKSGIMIDVAKASNGLSCDCTCASCGDRLIAKQGDFKQWHFAHESGAECAGSVESALHLAAKQIIKETGLVYVGKHNPVVSLLPHFLLIAEHEPDAAFRSTLYDIFRHGKHSILYKYASKETIAKLTEIKPKCERDVLQLADIELEKRAENSNLVPDITAIVDGQKIYIEVVVTHECDDDKIAKLKELNVPVVQLRLTPLMFTQFTLDDVKQSIVNGQIPDTLEKVYEWLVKPDYVINADSYAYDFLTESLSNFTAEGRDERVRKRALIDKKLADAAAKEAKKSKLRIFSTIVIVTEERFNVSIWMPQSEDNTAFNEVASVLSRFKAKRNDKNWLVSNPKLKQAIVDALTDRSAIYINNVNRMEEAKLSEAKMMREAKELHEIKLAKIKSTFDKQNRAENLRLVDEKRLERQSEYERLAALSSEQRKIEEAILIEQRRTRIQARKDAINDVIRKHQNVSNFKWRIKIMNDDLLSMGFAPIEPKDLPF